VIGASGLSDDDDVKNDGLKWKLADQSASGITFLPLVRYRHFVAAFCGCRYQRAGLDLLTNPPPHSSHLLFSGWT
jgi:hypothetical protein